MNEKKVADHDISLRWEFGSLASPAHENLAAFADWATPFLHTWTHVRLSAVLLRLEDRWVLRVGNLVLCDAASNPLLDAANERVWVGQRTFAIDAIPALLREVALGELSTQHSPVDAPVVLTSTDGSPFLSRSGSPSDATEPHYAHHEHQRYYRYEMSWEGSNVWGYFPDPGQVSPWWDDVQREFETLGFGTIPQAARRAGLLRTDDALYPDRNRFFHLIAPVPIAIEDLRQSPDRTEVTARLLRGTNIRSSLLTVLLEAGDQPVPAPMRLDSPGGDEVSFKAISRTGDVTVQVIYARKRIHRVETHLRTGLHSNIRLSAIEQFEDPDRFFESGLLQGKDLNEDSFERSVAQFLTMLGFSVCWWGRHRDPLMPKDKGDLVAFSADDGLVLIVDATVQPNKDLKSANLYRRTREMAASLEKASGKHPPVVEGLLVVGVPYDQIASHLRSPYPDVTIEVLARNQIEDVLQQLKQGIPLSEAVECLPELLRCGERAMSRLILWPRRYV